MAQRDRAEYPAQTQIEEKFKALESGEEHNIPDIPQPTKDEPETDELEDVPIPEYPTAEQIEESWAAYKRAGRDGILDFLRRQREKRQGEANP